MRLPAAIAGSLLALITLAQPVPPPATVKVAPRVQPVFVAVTAVDVDGTESDYSNELSATATNNQTSVTWDPVIGADGYKVYWGTNSGLYRWILDAGISQTQAFQAVPTVPVTNYDKFYAQSAPGLSRFTDVVATPFLVLTNVSGAGIVGPPRMYYRLRVDTGTTPP